MLIYLDSACDNNSGKRSKNASCCLAKTRQHILCLVRETDNVLSKRMRILLRNMERAKIPEINDSINKLQ